MDENMKKEIETLELIYFRVTDLWQRLCEKHNQLLNLTFDEYAYLLDSDLEGLDTKTAEKDALNTEIAALESVRADIIDELNKLLKGRNLEPISSISELIMVMDIYEKKNDQRHLFRFNNLLIDLIEKIQEQNKKNQLFINKALMSLKQIREEVIGDKNYSTYNNKGSHRTATTD